MHPVRNLADSFLEYQLCKGQPCPTGWNLTGKLALHLEISTCVQSCTSPKSAVKGALESRRSQLQALKWVRHLMKCPDRRTTR